ncbi:MAG TPA: HAMP domain-containing sensor histidine kinase [Solirubrobacteraceae bacterium]|nr:HAMP domain-containing sensor histidine kinase [Solirubrobacteraceae bacterium]
MASARVFRLPARTVRLRLTLLYSCLFAISGFALLAATYLIFRGSSGVDLIVSSGTSHHGAPANPEVLQQVRRMYAASVARNRHDLHRGLIQSGIALAIMSVISVALGWLVAGRVLRPVRTMTTKARQISEHDLSERLALPGPRDELKDLADTIDGLLARVQAHVAEQQRFAANASHELRTPLAITQTMLEVARSDPRRDTDQLLRRLHDVNARAIELIDALLLLSRADRRSFARDHVDLSLIAEEATEALLPLAEKHDVTIETSGELTATIGSHALLLQLTTNLVHNAIVHNLPERGSVQVTATAHPGQVVLTVANTGDTITPQLASRLSEPFVRGTERIHTDHAGTGLGLAIVKRITHAHDGTLILTPRTGGGLCAAVHLTAAPPGAQADPARSTPERDASSSASG